jgi:hypothetical protein
MSPTTRRIASPVGRGARQVSAGYGKQAEPAHETRVVMQDVVVSSGVRIVNMREDGMGVIMFGPDSRSARESSLSDLFGHSLRLV